MGHLGERVVLVHKLRQLAGAEELFHRRRNRLGVDQVLRHQAFAFRHGKTLFHRTLDTHQTDAELVLGHFAHAANTTVTQVIDIVHVAEAVTDIDQLTQHIEDVLAIQHAGAGVAFTTQATIELHPTNARQVVAVFGEEQVMEQRLGSLFGGRLAGAHHAINLDQRFQLRAGGIQLQSVGNERTAVEVVGVEGFDMRDTALCHTLEDFRSDFRVTRADQLTGFGIDLVFGQRFAEQILHRHFQTLKAGFFKLTNVLLSDPATLFDDDIAFAIFDVERGRFTAQA